MEITYDLIIKYLVNKQDIQNTFITQKNIYNYTFNDKFKLLLNDKFFRFGITIHNNNNDNISFWTSLLYLLDELNYTNQVNNNENEIINIFKEFLIDKYKKSTLDLLIKKLDKINIKDRLNNIPDNVCIQYIVDILDITILIFDFKTDEINIIYHNKILNPLKPIFLLSKYEYFWEPIMLFENNSNIKKIFNYNDNIIKNILTNNLIKYCDFIDNVKEFQLNTNINNIIINEKDLVNDDDNNNSNDDNNNNIIYKKEELLKKKNIELQDICNKINVLFTKKDTKNDLINKILSINIQDNQDNQDNEEINKDNLMKMKSLKLQEICTKLNITFVKKDTKKDLINKILCIINDT